MRSLDSIGFDTTGLDLEGDRPGVRVWNTSSGDGILLYYFSNPTNIPAGMDSIDQVLAFYRESHRGDKSRLVGGTRYPPDRRLRGQYVLSSKFRSDLWVRCTQVH